MSGSRTKNEEVHRNFEESLKEMPTHLRLVFKLMRSLYSDKNPGISTNISRKITKLRDETRQDTEIYSKVVLPLTTKLVCAIKEFYECYDALSYEEWCQSLPDILEDIKDNKDLAGTLLKMYEEIIVEIKKREDQAIILNAKSKNLQKKYQQEKKEFEDKAKTKRTWAFGLAFIPLVNLIAYPLLRSSANHDSVKAVAASEKSKIHESAVYVMDEALIPALTNFVNGLRKATIFFQIMEIEMNSLGMRKVKTKMTHYKIMKNKVQQINTSCNDFYAALSDIRTDFDAIPNEDSPQNNVEKWLNQKLNDIQRKRESTRKHFWNAIQGIQGISLRPIMPSSSLEPVEMSSDEHA